jgi:hypothetical protein
MSIHPLFSISLNTKIVYSGFDLDSDSAVVFSSPPLSIAVPLRLSSDHSLTVAVVAAAAAAAVTAHGFDRVMDGLD